MSPAEQRRQFENHILHYCPDAAGATLTHRVALLKARDWGAALRGRTDSPFALDLACSCHEIAGSFVFSANETESRLQIAADLCRRLAGAAMAADGLAATDDPGANPTITVQLTEVTPVAGGAEW